MIIEPNGVYNYDETAELLRQSKWSVRKKVRDGEIPGHRVGAKILIFGEDIRDYIQKQGRKPRGGFAKNSKLN